MKLGRSSAGWLLHTYIAFWTSLEVEKVLFSVRLALARCKQRLLLASSDIQAVTALCCGGSPFVIEATLIGPYQRSRSTV